MSHADLKATIEKAWDERDGVTPATTGEVRDAVNEALNLMDTGKARVAERGADGDWQVNQWLKQAVLLSFRLNDMTTIDGGPGQGNLVGQGAVQVRRLGRGRIQGRRLSRGAELHGAALGLYRAFRCADAVFRQPRRLCG
jgi:hypothetical protein